MGLSISTFNKRKDKGVMFFSASSAGDAQQLFNVGIKEILVSYHYIKKAKKFFDNFIVEVDKVDGLFMTDSGAFTIFNQVLNEEGIEKEEYWLAYLEEYVQWLWDNNKYIYVAANFDIEGIVGYEIVDKWNEKYFRPLEKVMNITYVPHGVPHGRATLLKRFTEYCKKFEYVGVPSGSLSYKNFASFYNIANQHKRRVHGFGWTSIPTLKSCPFFSVDSTSWLSGTRYGASYRYDGKNFVNYNTDWKHLRKNDRLKCKEWGINYENLMKEKKIEVNQYNLRAWTGARQEYLRAANIKLSNKAVIYYGKEKI